MEQTSIDKAIDVLFHLHASRTPVGVTSIGAALGIPKSSAHRLLVPLVRRGLVERDEGGRYRPGIGLVALGLGVLDGDPIVAAARPVLEAESRALGETLFLAAARNRVIVVLDKVEGANVLRVSPQVGSEVPVHATAVGKLYLAFAPDEVVMPSGRLARFTDATHTSRAALDAAVATARTRGWAENREEWHAGLAVLAAPIMTRERMLGAITLATPAARMPARDADRLGARLRSAAALIGERLRGEVTTS